MICSIVWWYRWVRQVAFTYHTNVSFFHPPKSTAVNQREHQTAGQSNDDHKEKGRSSRTDSSSSSFTAIPVNIYFNNHGRNIHGVKKLYTTIYILSIYYYDIYSVLLQHFCCTWWWCMHLFTIHLLLCVCIYIYDRYIYFVFIYYRQSTTTPQD